MAASKKCDRCGKFYDRNNRMGKGLYKNEFIDGIVKTTSIGNYLKQIDLCDECLDKLDIFLSGIGLAGFEKGE